MAVGQAQRVCTATQPISTGLELVSVGGARKLNSFGGEK